MTMMFRDRQHAATYLRRVADHIAIGERVPAHAGAKLHQIAAMLDPYYMPRSTDRFSTTGTPVAAIEDPYVRIVQDMQAASSHAPARGPFDSLADRYVPPSEPRDFEPSGGSFGGGGSSGSFDGGGSSGSYDSGSSDSGSSGGGGGGN